MNVVVLTRNPRGIASRFLARRPGPVILDEGAPSGGGLRKRLRKLRRVGWTAAPVGLALRRAYASAGEALDLDTLGVEVVRVRTLNSEDARQQLRRLGADVAVSLDNTLLEEKTFSLPPLGTINVHHGAVPEYRGGPPVFWELADGRDTVGFTIHRIDSGIDTGPVLASGEVPIERRGTLAATLSATIPLLHEASLDALEDVLRRLEHGEAKEQPQPRAGRHRTTPALADYLGVRRALRNYHRAP